MRSAIVALLFATSAMASSSSSSSRSVASIEKSAKSAAAHAETTSDSTSSVVEGLRSIESSLVSDCLDRSSDAERKSCKAAVKEVLGAARDLAKEHSDSQAKSDTQAKSDGGEAPECGVEVDPSNPFPAAPGTENFNGFPRIGASDFYAEDLIRSRAINVYLDAIPACSVYAMRVGVDEGYGVKPNADIAVFRGMDTRHTFLTPNSETIYGVAFSDVADGPMVLKVPPGSIGFWDDAWQRPVCDFGPAGADGGAGGTYVLFGPDHNEEDFEVPEEYFVCHTPTYMNWILNRLARDEDGGTVAAMEGYATMEHYRLGEEPRSIRVVDATDAPVWAIHGNGIDLYHELWDVIQNEPDGLPNSEVRGHMRSIGIVKGEPFPTEPKLVAQLERAAAHAYEHVKELTFPRADTALFAEKRIYDDRMWAAPFVGGSAYFLTDDLAYNQNARSLFTYFAAGTTPAMVSPKVGQGSVYLSSHLDDAGNYFNGSHVYQLHLPAPIPQANFWSVITYDPFTRAMVKVHGDEPFVPSLSSLVDHTPNDDDSVTITFAPADRLDEFDNTIETLPNHGYFVFLRLYSPLQPYFDQTWRPDNIVFVE